MTDIICVCTSQASRLCRCTLWLCTRHRRGVRGDNAFFFLPLLPWTGCANHWSWAKVAHLRPAPASRQLASRDSESRGRAGTGSGLLGCASCAASSWSSWSSSWSFPGIHPLPSQRINRSSFMLLLLLFVAPVRPKRASHDHCEHACMHACVCALLPSLRKERTAVCL